MKDDQERHVTQALEIAARKLVYDEDRSNVTPGDVVFQAILDVVDIDRRLPNRDRALLKGGSPWPSLGQSRDEMAELYKAMLARINAGDDPDEVFGRRFNLTAKDTDRWDALLGVLPRYVTGRSQARDLKILVHVAFGLSQRRVAKLFSLIPTRVNDICRMQCQAIASKLKALMPPVDLWCVTRDSARCAA